MAEPRQLGVNQRSGTADDRVIIIWECPNCGNYIGSSVLATNLDDEWNYDLKNRRTFPRSRCPDCGNNRVKRYAKLIPQDEVAEARKRVEAASKAEGTTVAL